MVVSVPPILLQLVLVLNRQHWEAAHRWLVLLSRRNSKVLVEVHLECRLQRALPLPLEVWVPGARGDHRPQVEFLTRLVEQILEVHLASPQPARLVEQVLEAHLAFLLLARLVEQVMEVRLAFLLLARLVEEVLEVHLAFLLARLVRKVLEVRLAFLLLARLVEQVLEVHLAFLLRLGLLLKTDSRSICSFGLVIMKSTPNN